MTLELDDEDYEALGWGNRDEPLSESEAIEFLRSAHTGFGLRWVRETTREGTVKKTKVARKVPLRKHGPRRDRSSKAWVPARRKAARKYKQSEKGREVVSKVNKKQYEKLKSDPVKYAARLAANRARYAERKKRET